MFEEKGTHVLLLGETSVPPSPLICMAELISSSNEIEEVFLCYSLCHVLSNFFFNASDDECDDTNEQVTFDNQHANLATSTVTSPSYVIRDKNATSIDKEKLENAKSITKDFHNVANLTKSQHKPSIINLNKQKESNATSIMDKQHEPLLNCSSSLVTKLDHPLSLGVQPQDYERLKKLLEK